MKVILIGISFLFVTSCLSSGTQITEEDISKVKFGKTSRAKLVKLFGEPQAKMDTTNIGTYYSKKCGKKETPLTALTYTYTKPGFASGSISSVTFLINKKNKVCNKSEVSNSTSVF